MARTNIYLKLEGVDGESIDEGHEQWIELESFKWNVKNDASFATGQGGQATQGHVDKITVDKICDNSSVTLFKNCTTGKHIKSGKIECLKLDGEKRVKYLEVELTDIMVGKVDWSGQGSEAVLHETVELEFAEFHKTYQTQQDTGDTTSGAVEFKFNRQTSKST
jgi:type VI secretion system secreted protein Hcp